jgi:glycosyl transferase family 4
MSLPFQFVTTTVTRGWCEWLGSPPVLSAGLALVIGATTVTRAVHVLLVSYLFPPADVSGVRRVAALRHELAGRGVRSSVVSSSVSGAFPGDEEDGIRRAFDLRTLATPRSTVPGLPLGPRVRARRRWWSRLVVPDTPALSWAPWAVVTALRLARAQRPDVVFTSSPPESVHLVGMALSVVLGIPWIADLRDGWTHEPPSLRPYASGLDRRLEGLVVKRADRVTAVPSSVAEDLRQRYGLDGRVVHLANGVDTTALAEASDERRTLDATRRTLVYTGTGLLNGKDLRPFLRAAGRLLRRRPELRGGLELVFAGEFADEELHAMEAPSLAGAVRQIGHLPHRRSLGLQRAADGLLLVTPAATRQTMTIKLYEYLAAERPIIALVERGEAADLLQRLGVYRAVSPSDEAGIEALLEDFADGSLLPSGNARLELQGCGFDEVADRLVELIGEVRKPDLSRGAARSEE